MKVHLPWHFYAMDLAIGKAIFKTARALFAKYKFPLKGHKQRHVGD